MVLAETGGSIVSGVRLRNRFGRTATAELMDAAAAARTLVSLGITMLVLT